MLLRVSVELFGTYDHKTVNELYYLKFSYSCNFDCFYLVLLTFDLGYFAEIINYLTVGPE